MLRNISHLLILIVLLSACAKKQKRVALSAPQAPVITSVTYTQGGSTQTIASLANSVTISPDYMTGACSAVSGTVEIIIDGQYDPITTHSISLSGVKSYTLSTSGETFNIVACAFLGAATISVNGIGFFDAGNTVTSFSVDTGAIKTAGEGLAKYPSPGFRVMNGSAKGTSLTSTAGPKLNNFTVGDHTNQTIASTGNTNLTMTVGYVSVLKELGQ